MNTYGIGIIDEEETDIDFIKRTILFSKPERILESQISFVSYDLSTLGEEPLSDLLKQVISDINADKIQIILVDYQILLGNGKIEGTKLFRELQDIVVKFPAILLTNLSDACYADVYVDADKVYEKKEFYKLENQYAKDKVSNIFRNMEKYEELRSKGEASLKQQVHFMLETGDGAALADVIEAESKLAEYKPMDQSERRKVLNVSDLREAVKLIKEAEELLRNI